MLRLLIDEDVHGDIVNGLRRRQPTLDLIRVQDVGLRHTPDARILEWAAQQGRVVVSVDKKTLAVDAWDRVARGLPMPGVAILRILLTIGRPSANWKLLPWSATPMTFGTKLSIYQCSRGHRGLPRMRLSWPLLQPV